MRLPFPIRPLILGRRLLGLSIPRSRLPFPTSSLRNMGSNPSHPISNRHDARTDSRLRHESSSRASEIRMPVPNSGSHGRNPEKPGTFRPFRSFRRASRTNSAIRFEKPWKARISKWRSSVKRSNPKNFATCGFSKCRNGISQPCTDNSKIRRRLRPTAKPGDSGFEAGTA